MAVDMRTFDLERNLPRKPVVVDMLAVVGTFVVAGTLAVARTLAVVDKSVAYKLAAVAAAD